MEEREIIEKIEHEAKHNYQNRIGRLGQYSSWLEAEMVMYKTMYKKLRPMLVNLFSQEVSELIDENKELRAKVKDLEDTAISLRHQKLQLSATCVTLQDDNKRLKEKLHDKRKNIRLQNHVCKNV